MKRNQKLLAIIYNGLGFVGIHACFHGFHTAALAKTLAMRVNLSTPIIATILTVLFFLSSFLLIDSRKEGFLIPIFLLTFLICGGFVILLPLLIYHLCVVFRAEKKLKFI